MAGMTQKELKKPYFHCGPIWKGKKIVISRSKTLKEIKAQNDMILKYLLFIFVVLCLLLPFSCYLFGNIGSLNCVWMYLKKQTLSIGYWVQAFLS